MGVRLAMLERGGRVGDDAGFLGVLTELVGGCLVALDSEVERASGLIGTTGDRNSNAQKTEGAIFATVKAHVAGFAESMLDHVSTIALREKSLLELVGKLAAATAPSVLGPPRSTGIGFAGVPPRTFAAFNPSARQMVI